MKDDFGRELELLKNFDDGKTQVRLYKGGVLTVTYDDPVLGKQTLEFYNKGKDDWLEAIEEYAW